MADLDDRVREIGSQDMIGFVTGTCLATDMGEVPVDWLRPGDRLLTRDGGYLPLRAIRRTEVAADAVVMIDRPTHPFYELSHPILLSRQHGVLIFASQDHRRTDRSERLIPAASVPGAVPSPRSGPLLCYTIALDTHQIVLANGLWVEVAAPDGAVKPARPRHPTTRPAPLRPLAA